MGYDKAALLSWSLCTETDLITSTYSHLLVEGRCSHLNHSVGRSDKPVCFSLPVTIVLPASPVVYCGLSSPNMHPCTQDQAVGKCIQPLPGLGQERVARLADLWEAGFVGQLRTLRVYLGKSHFPGENGVSEKISDWS